MKDSLDVQMRAMEEAAKLAKRRRQALKRFQRSDEGGVFWSGCGRGLGWVCVVSSFRIG